MKSFNYIKTIFILITAIGVISCSKDLDETEDLGLLTPASIDSDAKDWLPIEAGTMTVTKIAVPIPVDTTDAVKKAAYDATYQSDLAAIKDSQSKLTESQRKVIEYWGAGGVLRWNQILRKLVAQYSLAPAPRDDGSYVFPDAENPFADPQFPFSSPPYAARAYSYVSVAQYEALKSAWYYKDLYKAYKRKAPYNLDNTIQALVPKTDLLAYPSEDGVMSGVTVELLKALFPASIEEITLHAAEQRNAALWSGKATATDISVGLALGKSVAALYLARAKGDGMGKAIGIKAQWAVLADSAKLHYAKIGVNATNEIFWKSLDAPARPPMLPFFGNVSTWIVTRPELVSKRPGPPPSTSSEKMKTDLAEVKSISENLTREQLAIVHKWADGGGTYTPPGHWNDIAAEHIRDANFSEVRAARAFALLNMAMHNASVGCWEAKYYWFNPRPSQLDPSIKTATGLPNFPAFVSGHSTFSASAATVLSYLFPSSTSKFNADSEEASISRLYGGIHYRADIEVGKTHGAALSDYIVNFALTDGAD